MIKTLIEGNPKFKKELPDDPNVLEVAEFFMNTIQGEGINTGQPSAFLRLKHCTLNCVWCFHPNTHVLTYGNGQKKIKDIKEGDVLLTLDEQHNIVQTTVQKTMKRDVSIKDTMLKIETDRKSDKPLVVTKNHSMFVKDKGWIEARFIKEGDVIISVEGQQVSSYLMTQKNPMKDEKIKQKTFSTQKELRKQGVIKPYKRTKAHKKLHSDLKKGEGNPMKRHSVRKSSTLGHSYSLSSLEKRFITYFRNNNLPVEHTDTKLSIGDETNGYHFPDFLITGKKKVIEVYDTTFPLYKNGKRTKENYQQPLETHYNKYGYEVMFLTQEDLADKPRLQEKLFSFVFNGKTVTDVTTEFSSKSYAALFGSTKQETTEVYNLSCFPYNTYLANGMLAHNCDTQEVWRYGNPYTFDELLGLMETHGLIEALKARQHLVLTGGSPIKQQKALELFISFFISKYGFKPYIEIENECTIMPSQRMMDYVDCWNNSPKLSNSGNLDIVRYQPKILKTLSELDNSWFKFVITGQQDWQEIKKDFLDPALIKARQVILMPEGATREELARSRETAIELATANNVRYCDRLHVVVWDKKTGV